MSSSLCPPYLSALIPTSVGRSTAYSLRNADDIRNIHCRSQLMIKSFLPSTIRSWNALPEECRLSPSLSTFKSNLKKQNRPANIPAHYYVGDRAQNIHHARLRMNCSHLKAQLFSKNIIDSPLCQCGVIEDTYHTSSTVHYTTRYASSSCRIYYFLEIFVFAISCLDEIFLLTQTSRYSNTYTHSSAIANVFNT